MKPYLQLMETLLQIQSILIMGGQLSQPSKLQDSNIITGLSYLEDGQFSKIYKVGNFK